jgi:elongation factor P--(R)-beta-lysine ligase
MPVNDEFNRLARLSPNLKRRAFVFDAIRAFFKEHEFLEVDTPIRAPAIAPEPNIVPFESEGWFLAASPELHMKRLLAAGYGKLFQFSHCFRKGERGLWHNPEFIMLEWYRKGAGYLSIIQDMEQMALYAAERLGLGHIIHYQGRDIDITPPWPRITVKDAYLKAAGWDPVLDYDPARFDVDFIARVLPSFSPLRPTVLLDYPAAAASLARLKPEDNKMAERVEVFMGGLELANAFSELTDAHEQAARFREATGEIRQERGKNMPLPEKFLESVARLPDCGGIALGMDRLVMLFCDAPTIDDVMAFTSDTA